MSDKLINFTNLENVLKTHWSEFIDPVQLMRLILEHIRNTSFKKVEQDQLPKRHTQFSITKFSKSKKEGCFSALVEFSTTRAESVVIGSMLLDISWSGQVTIKETFGTEFAPKIS